MSISVGYSSLMVTEMVSMRASPFRKGRLERDFILKRGETSLGLTAVLMGYCVVIFSRMSFAVAWGGLSYYGRMATFQLAAFNSVKLGFLE